MSTKIPYEDYFPTDRNEIHFQRYKKFILRCINRGHLIKNPKRLGEIEYHHILPSSLWDYSLGGDKVKNQIYLSKDVSFNVIGITLREHFIAHLILWKAFPENHNGAMIYAFWEYFNIRNFSLTSKQYDLLKSDFCKKISERMCEENNPFYNLKHSQESKEKISLKKSNQIWINNGLKEHQLEPFLAQELLKSGGWVRKRLYKFTDEVKKRISESVSGFKWVTNEIEEIQVQSEELEIYLNNGYKKGMLKRVWIYKEGVKKRILEKDLDFYRNEGWTIGYLSSMTEEQALQISNTLTGSRWFNNQKEQRYVSSEEVSSYLESPNWKEGQLPKLKGTHVWMNKSGKQTKILKEEKELYKKEGWNEGRGRVSSQQQKEALSKSNRGKKWINNGEIQIRVHSEEIFQYKSKGWVEGQLEKVLRSPEKSEKCGIRTRGKKWMNKEGKNIRISKEELQNYLSTGWKKGMTKKSKHIRS